MKRAIKIFAWTVCGLILTIVVVASIAIYVVFTPERLTLIAREAAAKYITCEHEIGEVDLTFFSTFPRFGLRADGLLLVNPKEGAQNDTVVSAGHLTATVNVTEFLNHKNLYIHEAVLDDAEVHFYIAPDGTTNLTDVFVTSPDTTEEDTSSFSLPFDKLRVDGLRIKANAITFVDDKDTIDARLGETELSAKADSWEDMLLALDARDVCARMKGDTYADSLHIELIAPVAVDLDKMYFAFDGARLAVNDFQLRIEGDVTVGDTIGIDAKVETGKWQIKPLLGLVPEKFTSALKDIDIDGEAQLEASVKGTYSNSQMPLVNAHLTLKEGKGKYKPLPYTLRDVSLEADAALDMNQGGKSNVTIHKAHAATRNSQVSILPSQVDDLLGDMVLDLQVALDANLPDFAYFMPDSMLLTGRTKGTAKAKMRLSDLTGKHLEKGRISADLALTNIHFEQDSMVADLPNTKAHIQIPNAKPSRKSVNWARIDLDADQVGFVKDTTIAAALGTSTIRLEAGNVLDKEQDYLVALNTDALKGFFEDIHADLKASQLEAYVSGGKRVSAKLNTASLDASVGTELEAKTGALALEASARYNSEGENALLKWNPRVKVNLKSGKLTMPERLPEPVVIPSIEFSYSNRAMNIENSRIELGNSDLNIKGNVRNIGKWFRHKEILEGELDIVSDHCDANQLMAWFSSDDEEEQPAGDGSTAEQSASASTAESDKDPFMVPKDVDLAIHTHMREVEVFNQLAKDLKGGLFVRNGILILDEMGFVCKAAKLQLTAMYRTPRRNDLYIGLDYHMIDVDIDELLTMIPNLEEMVPMLSSFKGAARFHLAAETYLTSQYKPKMSTLRGAASLSGKDLVVLDGETFSEISKLLMFNKKTENRIDSLNAEITIYKKEIDVYPLCVQMDNYMVALGGRHNTDMTFDYDINVLSPIYLGVNVSGNIDNLNIKLAPYKYSQDFRPRWYEKADTQSAELRQRIRQSMERNVRIQ